jgi:hypothetical protein
MQPEKAGIRRFCCRRITVKIFFHYDSKLRCNVQKQFYEVEKGHFSEKPVEI